MLINFHMMTTVARPFMRNAYNSTTILKHSLYSLTNYFLLNQFYLSNKMQEIKTLFFKKNHFNNLLTSYQVPKQYIDCRQLNDKHKQSNERFKRKQLTNQQKIIKFKKEFYLDSQIKPFQQNPSPDKYTENYSTVKRYKSQSTFITRSKGTQNLGKRPTWIQDIQKYQQKFKNPGVAKYKTELKSDFRIKKRSQSIQKLSKNGTKFNYLDDTVYISSQIPGPGSHNPHKSIPKLKVNLMTIQSVLKHEADKRKIQKRLSSSSLSNISSCSYSPVKDKTFDSISITPKKEGTLMRLTNIDKRIGKKSQYLSPGPGAHDTINKWANQTFKRQKLIGKLNLFGKTTKSFPSLSVYH